MNKIVGRIVRASSASVFSDGGTVDFAAQVIAHQLHAIANSQHRQSHVENRGVAFWRACFVHAVGAA